MKNINNTVKNAQVATNSKLIGLVAGLLMTCLLPLTAGTTSWNSTSTIMDVNNGFTPSVTEVGAQKAATIPMQSTSTMMQTGYVPTPKDEETQSTPRNIRRSKENPGDPGDTGDESSPIGEPWVLIVFAASAAGVIAWRRRGVRSTIDNNRKG